MHNLKGRVITWKSRSVGLQIAATMAAILLPVFAGAKSTSAAQTPVIYRHPYAVIGIAHDPPHGQSVLVRWNLDPTWSRGYAITLTGLAAQVRSGQLMALSPDQQLLAFLASDGSKTWMVVARTEDGKIVFKCPFVSPLRLGWSTDSGHLMLLDEPDNTDSTVIYLVPPGKKTVTRVAKGPTWASWAGSGKLLLIRWERKGHELA